LQLALLRCSLVLSAASLAFTRRKTIHLATERKQRDLLELLSNSSVLIIQNKTICAGQWVGTPHSGRILTLRNETTVGALSPTAAHKDYF
jgi:hypothetical protein